MKFDSNARKTAWFNIKGRQSGFLIIVGFSVILLVLIIAAFSSPNNKNAEEIQIALSTNKEIYHSSETMLVTVDLPKATENATLSIRGIKDSQGRYRVQQDYSIPSDSFRKEANFTFTMPSCYGCAGISPGDYEISAELFSGSLRISGFNKTIRLEK